MEGVFILVRKELVQLPVICHISYHSLFNGNLFALFMKFFTGTLNYLNVNEMLNHSS